MEPAAGVVESRSARAGARHDHGGRRGGAASCRRPARARRTRWRSLSPPTTRPPTSRPASPASAGTWTSPSPSAPWSRSSTTAVPTARLWSRSGWPRPSTASRPSSWHARAAGYALRTAWSASEAEVVAYMDVDLSTSLSALLPLVGSVLSGHSDLAVGTRLARGSRVVRGPKRELISRALQPHGAALAAQPRLGLPMWLQGHQARTRAPDPASGRRRRMVLRHRADRDGRAARRAHF